MIKNIKFEQLEEQIFMNSIYIRFFKINTFKLINNLILMTVNCYYSYSL